MQYQKKRERSISNLQETTVYLKGKRIVKLDGISYAFVPSEDYLASQLFNLIESYCAKDWSTPQVNLNIIDLGCGISPILLYLEQVRPTNTYLKLTGIDYDRNLLKILKTLSKRIDTSYGNLLNLSKKNKDIIAQQDIIYLYRPIRRNEEYASLIKEVWKIMKPGAALADYYCMSDISHILGVKYSGKAYIKPAV